MEKETATLEDLKRVLEEMEKKALEAVDISARLRLQEPQAWPEVARYWEKALGSLWFYIKDKSKEIKQNLLAGIHFPPRRPVR